MAGVILMLKKTIIIVIITLILAILTIYVIIGIQNSNQSPYKDFIVVDVFDTLANFQGIQSGWFAKVVKDKFNMELNIIAPNVAGGGDTLYQMRSSTGNLGDLIITSGERGNFQKMVSSGLILDMSPYLKNSEIRKYQYSIDLLNSPISDDAIYAIPSEVSTSSPLVKNEIYEPTFGPFVRWDLYKQLGYPEMETLEDLLPVLKGMQDLYPVTESGQKTYGFSFFNDWDGNLMNAIKQPACFYGYDEIGFVLAKADGSDYQNILDEDSLYMRVLRFFFEANQLGLVDPDSLIQDIDNVSAKYKEGAIFFCPWPWFAQPGFNTLENREKGMGYMMAPINDLQIFSYGCNPQGNQKTIIAVGSQAKDPERLVDFIEWLYSSEGIMISCSYNGGDSTAGIKGLTWDTDEDGEPYLTEFGVKALMNGDADVPEEYGGGTWKEGASALNFKPVSKIGMTEDGIPYLYSIWTSTLKYQESALDLDWRNHMGATTTIEYLEKNNQIIVAPGTSYVAGKENSELSTIRSQCSSLIVEYSWNMVFADDLDTFNNLANELRIRVNANGYDQILSLDYSNALKQQEARTSVVKAFESYERD